MRDKFWDAFFRDEASHYFCEKLKEWKKDTYEKIYDRALKNTKDSKVLVTDCYDLYFGLDLADRLREENNVVNIDISSKCVRKVARKYDSCLKGDVRNLPFKSDSIDVIVSPSTLDHFGKRDFIKSLNEIKRILKKGGKAIILLHNKKNIFLRFQILNLRTNNHYVTYTRKELVSILSRYKELKITDSFYVLNYPLPGIFTAIFNYLDKFGSEIKLLDNMTSKIINNLKKTSQMPYVAELICLVIEKT